MDVLGIIGIFVSLAILIIGLFKGFHAIVVTIVASIVCCLFNRLDIWDTLTGAYAPGFGGIVSNYLLMMLTSCIFSSLMSSTGAATALAYRLLGWFGRSKVMLILNVAYWLLAWGGVSIFIIMFCLGPITKVLCKEANYPRHFMMIPISFGILCPNYYLPGSTQLVNVVPGPYLGTGLAAAPVLGILLSAVATVLAVFYIRTAIKRSARAGEGWTYIAGEDPAKFALDHDGKYPSIVGSFLPLIVIVVFVLIVSFADLPISGDVTLVVVLAMLLGSALCLVFNGKYLPGGAKEISNVLSEGARNSLFGVVALAAVMAFGSVVISTKAFSDIVAWVMRLSVDPYWKAVISSAVFAGMTGAGTTGVRMASEYLGEYFLEVGADPEITHRLICLGSSTIESLPHASGLYLIMDYFGMKYSAGYKHTFWLTVIIPVILVLIFTPIITLIY